MSPTFTELEATIEAQHLMLNDKIYDPVKAGTHGQRIEVQWIGRHEGRKRTYVAGVEERTRFPVTLAYDDRDTVKIYR